jgi:hypothetical protein
MWFHVTNSFGLQALIGVTSNTDPCWPPPLSQSLFCLLFHAPLVERVVTVFGVRGQFSVLGRHVRGSAYSSSWCQRVLDRHQIEVPTAIMEMCPVPIKRMINILTWRELCDQDEDGECEMKQHSTKSTPTKERLRQGAILVRG